MNFKKSISNIAWEYQDNEKIFKVLKKNGFKHIEVAPIELIDDWSNPDWQKLKYFKKLINQYDLKVCSMQSIFYSTNYSLYSDFDKCIDHFKKVEEICNLIECDYVVFGAPKLRNAPQNMKKENAYDKLNSFFEKVKTNLKIGIEAVPEIYSTNILNNYTEVNDFVTKSNIGLNIHFDTAAALFYGFDNSTKIDTKKITNIHLSKLYLKNLSGEEDYVKMIMDKNFLNKRFLSIEMKKSSFEMIENAIKIFNNINQ